MTQTLNPMPEAERPAPGPIADEPPPSFGHFWRKFWELGPDFRQWIIPGVIRGVLRMRAFDSRELVFLGSGVTIKRRRPTTRIVTGRGVRIASGCFIDVGGLLSIGTRAVIGPNTRIMSSTEVRIGARCMISWNCSIFDSIGHRLWLEGTGEAEIEAPITIGDDVWIGPYSIIMKGVTIGNNSVVGAGSVVRQQIPPNSLVYGNPARRVGTIERWER